MGGLNTSPKNLAKELAALKTRVDELEGKTERAFKEVRKLIDHLIDVELKGLKAKLADVNAKIDKIMAHLGIDTDD